MSVDTIDFLELLRDGGFTVHSDGVQLFVNPGKNLTPVDCDTIRRLKPQLLELLAEERWEKCSVCHAGVDSAAVEDLARLCDNGDTRRGKGCPFKLKMAQGKGD